MENPIVKVKKDNNEVRVLLPLDMSAENYGKFIESLGRMGSGSVTDEVRGVKIGDRFKDGKHIICEVVDFHETRSLSSGNIVSIQAIAKGMNTIAKNTFPVPFSTIMRNKI